MSRVKYFFIPSRWKSFGIHLLRTLLKKIDGSEWTPEVHEIEQYMYRYLKCEECVIAGVCQNSDCGCKMPERAHVRTDSCPTMRWGPFLSKRGWELYKKREEILFVVIKEQQNV